MHGEVISQTRSCFGHDVDTQPIESVLKPVQRLHMRVSPINDGPPGREKGGNSDVELNNTFMIFAAFRSRTFIHFLQESVRFHFQDLGRQCIILAGILEDL